MIRLRNLYNKFQKRTLRVEYGQTQAYPYAATLDTSVYRNADGSWITITADYTIKGSLCPGLVMVKANDGETVQVATGSDSERPFGLLANFVAGELDELGDENQVGVWRGVGSVYTILSPAFNDSDTSAAGANSQAITAGISAGYAAALPLYAGADGRLASFTTGHTHPVCYLVQRVSASRIVVDLVV